MNHSSVTGEVPTFASFCNSLLWLILSKALKRSNNTKAVSFFLSIASNIESVVKMFKVTSGFFHAVGYVEVRREQLIFLLAVVE